MSDDEEAELQALRAARAARAGSGATLNQLRELQRAAQRSADAAAAFLESRQQETSQPQPQPASEDDEDEPTLVEPEDGRVLVDEEAEIMTHEMRQQFPMAFGEQEKHGAKLPELHQQNKRTVGPPRPPAATAATAATAPQSRQMGPPRPPASAAGDGAASLNARIASGSEAGPSGREHVSTGADNAGHGEQGEDGSDEDDESGGAIQQYRLPITHEVSIGGHSKAVVTLDVEHSGSRLLTGSMDYTVRIYDFAGMKADLRSFRELEPHEGHPVHALSWSPSGDSFLCVTGAATAKVYDRDGRQKGECIRGDMYIRDLKNTKGHISGLCSGQWHPIDKTSIMTCSEDGSVRLWDATTMAQKTVIKPTLARPVRTAVTACAYSSDGGLIGAGLMDGTIQLWNVAGSKFGSSAAIGAVGVPRQQMVARQDWSYVSTSKQMVPLAHAKDSEISSLAFSQDGNCLASRGMDETLKLWDLRRFQKPLHVFAGLPAAYATTRCIFSPDESLVATGVSGGPNSDGGAIIFFDRHKLQLAYKVAMPGSVTGLLWHHRLNQIFAGVGNRKTGATHVLYDTAFSERGVMQCVARAPRKVNPLDFQPPLLIKAPHTLPMFREEVGRKRVRDDSKASAKAKQPNPGMTAGAGKQGRIGTTTKTLLTQHIMKQKGKPLGEVEEDPREAILRHGAKTGEMQAYTNAYAATQPTPIFAKDSDEEDNDEEQA